jgi:DNA primase
LGGSQIGRTTKSGGMMAEKNFDKRQLTLSEAQQVGNMFIGQATIKGGSILYKCCFHDDNNPSMQLWDSKTGPRFKCHACGWGGKSGGDAYDMVGQLRGLSFCEAVNTVLEKLGDAPPLPTPPPKKQQVPEIPMETRGKIYTELINYTALSVSGAEYLEGRGLDVDHCHKSGLRCFDDGDLFRVQNHMKKKFSEAELIGANLCNSDKKSGDKYFSLLRFRGRILIPYHWNGSIVGLQGRATTEEMEKKYCKYSTAWIPSLYIPQGVSDKSIGKSDLWITEGAFDALAHIQHSGRSIAFSGASVCDEKVQKAAAYFARMNPPRIVLAIEEDQAGDGLRTRLKQNLVNYGYPAGRIDQWDIPQGVKDLCEFYALPTPEEVEGRRKMEEAAAFLQNNMDAKQKVDEILAVFPDAEVVEITHEEATV